MSGDQRRLPRTASLPVVFVGLRYLRAVRQTRGVSFISLVSVAGLVLGVTALVTVLSVMNGFDRELRARILGIVPHVLVRANGVAAEEILSIARALPQVRGAAAYAEVRGMLTTGTRVVPVALVGIDPRRERELSPLPAAMVSGEVEGLTAEGGVLLGTPLAARIGVIPGDRVSFLLPRASGDTVQPLLVTAPVVGLFRFGAEPDQAAAFMHVDALVRLARLAGPDVRIALDDLYAAAGVSARLRANPALSATEISDWTERYGELFDAVGMEKTMMGLLLGLIVAIAVFNIVAGLAMVVDEKRGAIAILRTLGATRGDVVGIFVFQGALIGVVGVAAGLGFGVVLALNIGDLMAVLERSFGFQLLAGTYFDRLPSELRGDDLVWVGSLALATALAGALYPALRAGRVDPAPALHGL
ncbi:MAG: FtsX-like permease family protein [Pseudomonadales bacterium]|jgi:lipoprotein-releasing system permease protein|nr:FtsX-like permease family protein [Pseudomonadales bacterium]